MSASQKECFQLWKKRERERKLDEEKESKKLQVFGF